MIYLVKYLTILLISSTIWGHQITEEAGYEHIFNPTLSDGPMFYNGTPSGYPCDAFPPPAEPWVADNWVACEVPPQNVSDANQYVKGQNSIQKTVVMEANHGRSIWENQVDDASYFPLNNYNPCDYLKMTGIVNPKLPDVFLDGSYLAFPSYWKSCTYSNIRTNNYGINYHYLGAFKTIDWAYTHVKEVHKVITNESTSEPIYHSDVTIKNANWLWFQAYTSIIHKAKGIWFWDFDGIRGVSETSPTGANQFEPANFPALYKKHIKFLSQELAVLKNSNLLSSDEKTIVASKTDNADVLGIVPAASSYLNTNTILSDGTVLPTEFYSENYGLRYTIRTNGNEVIMIISNPLPITLNNITLNFGQVANPIIRNSTGIDVLFKSNSATSAYPNVSTSNYKTIRDCGNTSITATLAQLNKYSIAYNSNKQALLSFGPMDVHVLRFVGNNQVVLNNNWQKVWSNNGTGNFGGVGPVTNNHIWLPGDFNADGEQEMLHIQNAWANSWTTLLKYNSNSLDWDWLWSNYGTGVFSQYSPNLKYYVGNFDGLAGDELLIMGNTGWVAINKFINNNWVETWNNGGNGLLASAWNLNNAHRYYVGNFDGVAGDELLAISGTNSCAAMFKFNNGFQWYWTSSCNVNLTDAWDQNINHKYIVGDYNGNGKDDLFCMSGTNNYEIYLEFDVVQNKWIWKGSNNGVNTVATWSLPFASTDKILSGNIDGDNLSELMFVQRGTSASLVQTADYSAATLTKRWSATGYINDWPVNDQTGFNTDYLFIKPKITDPKYLMAFRSYGASNSYLINMYKSTASNNRVRFNQSPTVIAESRLNIYPNPVSSTLIIENKNDLQTQCNLVLTNIQGQKIISKEIEFTNEYKLDVSLIEEGVYFLLLKNDSFQITEKIVITK